MTQRTGKIEGADRLPIRTRPRAITVHAQGAHRVPNIRQRTAAIARVVDAMISIADARRRVRSRGHRALPAVIDRMNDTAR